MLLLPGASRFSLAYSHSSINLNDLEAMMKMKTPSHAEQELTHLAQQFDDWRQRRTTRTERIPSPLWEQAVALTAGLPMAHVAQQLRLRGSDLKKRCAVLSTPTTPETPGAVLGFVDVTPPPAWPLAPLAIEVDLQRSEGDGLSAVSATASTAPENLAASLARLGAAERIGLLACIGSYTPSAL